MRIVAGAYRGRALVAPKGHSTRPTADRARQALFNVVEHAAWAPRLSGARAADIFAGSGALGLEALSRNVSSCLFIDNDSAALAAIGDNIAALGLADRALVRRADAASLPAAPEPFDLVFLDPPYQKDLVETCLRGLARGRWLTDRGIAVVERGAGEAPPVAPDFEVLDNRQWGAARVWFLRLRP